MVRLITILMSTPCQGKMAIDLPIRIVGYPCFQDGIEHRKEFTSNSNNDMHLRFTGFHST